MEAISENEQGFVTEWAFTQPIDVSIDFSGFFLFFAFICFVVGFIIARGLFTRN